MSTSTGIRLFHFLSVTTTSTVTGYLVDVNGRQCTNAFTYTVPAASTTTPPTPLETIAGTVPTEAVGLIADFSHDVYVGRFPAGSAYVNDMTTVPTRYPVQAAGFSIALGNVAAETL